MVYERTKLSTNRHPLLNSYVKQAELTAENIFRDAYMLEFLGLEEKEIYTETDLEHGTIYNLSGLIPPIIDNLSPLSYVNCLNSLL